MIYTISNDYLTAQVNSMGAELTALFDNRDGTRYVCPEANSNWENIAPVLFPNTGLVKDGAYIGGKRFEYVKHGFARDFEFELRSQSKNSLVFSLQESKNTLEIFPYEFCLSISFILDGRQLSVRTDIENRGKVSLSCSLGFHPGFSCPLVAGEKAEDYEIAFPTAAQASRLNLQGGLVASKTEHFLNGVYELPIKEKMFDNGSFSLTDLNFSSVKLQSKKSGRHIRMDFSDYPNLVLWAPRHKPISVLCIEPWFGQPDRVEGEKDISEKPYTIRINPESLSSFCFSVTCN